MLSDFLLQGLFKILVPGSRERELVDFGNESQSRRVGKK